MAPTIATLICEYGGAQDHEAGGCRLKQPRGLRIAEDGALLVADCGLHCVARFRPSCAQGDVVAGEMGKMLEPVDPMKDLDRPLNEPEGEGVLLKRPVDACQHGGKLLVLDMDGCRIQQFSLSQPGTKASIVMPSPLGPPQSSTHAPEAVKYPRAMRVQPDGSLVVSDSWSHRIVHYPVDAATPEVLAGVSNSFGSRADQLAFPSGFSFDTAGGLIVADTNNHRVQRFALGSRDAETIAGSVDGIPGAGSGALNMPTGLCVDPRDGSFLVADRVNARVLRFAANSRAGDAGKVVADSTILQRPWGVCMDRDGFIYVSDERRGVVLKLAAGEDDSDETHKVDASKEFAFKPPPLGLIATDVEVASPGAPVATMASVDAPVVMHDDLPVSCRFDCSDSEDDEYSLDVGSATA